MRKSGTGALEPPGHRLQLSYFLFPSPEGGGKTRLGGEVRREEHLKIEIEIVYNMYRMRRFTSNTVCAGCCLWALPTMPYRELTS
jgi:hypothetical protein